MHRKQLAALQSHTAHTLSQNYSLYQDRNELIKAQKKTEQKNIAHAIGICVFWLFEHQFSI